MRKLKFQNYFAILIALILSSATVMAQENSSDSLSGEDRVSKILNLAESIANDPSKHVSNLAGLDLVTLPVGIVKEIGNTKYIICIDSAFFEADKAYFNVYMALDFPKAQNKLAFAAKKIQFNPEGVLLGEGARLQLVQEQQVKIGPKLSVIFKGSGKNFIEWDCNGYKQAGLHLDFVFGGEMLENAINPQLPVKAEMEMVVQDLNNITFALNEMTPFKMRGVDDLTFQLQDIVIDQSEFMTPSGVSLTNEQLTAYNGDRNSWKGFYAGNALVTLPSKLSKETGNGATQIYAQNLFIDDSGLTGTFGANNLFTISEGKMNSKWDFSVQNIQVDIACNHFKSGSITGEIMVPPLDDNVFSYSAQVNENPERGKLDYNFTIGIGSEPVTISAVKSQLTLQPGTSINVQNVGERFVPTAKLTGNWLLDFPKAKIAGIEFQNLTITTEAPYITDGYFGLVANQDASQAVKFPISISNIGLGFSNSNLTFYADIGLNLGGDNFSFGANTSVRVITKLEDDQGRTRLKYDRFAVDDIALSCATSVFELNGLISIRNDDPVFGDLFYGSISLSIQSFLDSPIMVSVGFGKMPSYKYWFTDVSLPITVPIMPGLDITSIYGGVMNRVNSNISTSQLLDRVVGNIALTPSEGQNSAIPFVPDENMGLTFRAGVGLAAKSEKVFNGDVVLSLSFNSSGGFESILFAGRAYMMVKRNERDNTNASKVFGQVEVLYDNAQKVLDANVSAQITVPNVLTGSLWNKIHIDKNDWYFWLNRPTDRANVNIIDLFNVYAYFMVGTVIEPIPNPPSYVSSLSTFSPNSMDLSALGNGGGFCTGMEISMSFGGEFPKNTKWRGYASAAVGAGFDVMLFNVANARCNGNKIGVNNYYAVGQVYAYLNGSFGARKYKNKDDENHTKEYAIGSLTVAALLQGKLPKPTFVSGGVLVEVQLLGIINFNFTAKFEVGDNCNITNI